MGALRVLKLIHSSSSILEKHLRIFKYPGLFQEMLEYGIQAKEREGKILEHRQLTNASARCEKNTGV